MGPGVVWEFSAIRPTDANATRTPNMFLDGVGLPFCLDQTMLQEMKTNRKSVVELLQSASALNNDDVAKSNKDRFNNAARQVQRV